MIELFIYPDSVWDVVQAYLCEICGTQIDWRDWHKVQAPNVGLPHMQIGFALLKFKNFITLLI
jgi:hypothetical protein